MNSRERFLATMRFQPVDRRPLWEWHYLPATIERWYGEGLPATVSLDAPWGVSYGQPSESHPQPLAVHLGLDRGQPYCQGCTELLPVRTGMLPGYPVQVLEEDESSQTLIDADGVKKLILKHISPAMPQFLDFPLHDRNDFVQMARRYDPTTPARYPADWQSYVVKVQKRDYPLGLTFDGFFGRLRNWMGLEGLCYALADDSHLVAEMCEFHTEFILQTIERALADVQVDYVNIWEDMAYKAGSLMSPTQVRRWMLPGYRRIVDRLHAHGIDIIFVDCDGNIDELIPIWLEAGINGVWPLEAASDMNPVTLRRRYGRNLLLVGGIDKRELSRGRDQVQAEVQRIVPQLYAEGGYIPTVDHSVPPDVPYENYVYFRQSLAELANRR
ncbi:MAG: uroporphyrinogen decarboxylase family protein [Anaerolineae bacterium]